VLEIEWERKVENRTVSRDRRSAATPGRSTLLVPWGRGSDTGSTSSPSILFRISSGVGVLVVGGVVAEVRAGHDTAKKKAHSLREEKARESNVSGGMASGTGTAVRE